MSQYKEGPANATFKSGGDGRRRGDHGRCRSGYGRGRRRCGHGLFLNMCFCCFSIFPPKQQVPDDIPESGFFTGREVHALVVVGVVIVVVVIVVVVVGVMVVVVVVVVVVAVVVEHAVI